jgi:endonuclease/exonuclease/phosphatase family metal-dependent hydrolase
MKNLSWFNKIMFFFNTVVAVLTILAYLLSFINPTFLPILSILTLVLPFFLILNGLFFVYWLLQFKKQIFLSVFILLIGFSFINKFYKFSGQNFQKSENDFSVMSYNVRLFNLFQWIDDKTIPSKIQDFINHENPDILCIQEYSSSSDQIDLRVYPYQYILSLGNKIKTAQAIFSKFPIINSGNIEFPNSNNNAVFADIKKSNEIIRVYNIHLESLKISPDVKDISEGKDELDQSKSKLLAKRISDGFLTQQVQAELIKKHKATCKYPILICGDMNNSAYSSVYRSIRGQLNDCFEDAGKGFGETYNFKFYPARIDYIFTDKSIKTKSFTSFSNFKHSDHTPISCRLEIE